MPKKLKKLETLKQTHAKEETQQITSLDEVWGYNRNSRYQTIDEATYESSLKEMTRSDLENHARALGSIIVEDSGRIRNELMKLFRAYVLSLKKPAPSTASKIKVTAEVQKILNEAR